MLGAPYAVRAFKNYRADQVCGACVMGFSTGCLTISRKFSLLFENTMKTSCCFIVFFRQTFLYVSVIFSCIYFSLWRVKIDGKTNSSTYLTSKIYYSFCQIYILPARYICCILGRICNFFHKLSSISDFAYLFLFIYLFNSLFILDYT